MKYEVFKNPEKNEYAFLCIDEYADVDSPRTWGNLGTYITWMNNSYSPDDNCYHDLEDFTNRLKYPSRL